MDIEKNIGIASDKLIDTIERGMCKMTLVNFRHFLLIHNDFVRTHIIKQFCLWSLAQACIFIFGM